MSAPRVLAEAVRLIGAQWVFTSLIAIISAISVFAGVVASGQGIANERNVLAAIDDADTTTIVIRDVDGNANLGAATIDRILALSHVAWAIGLGPALDAGNARVGTATDAPVKRVVGSSPALGVSTRTGAGAWLSPASQRALHLAQPAGALRRSDGNEYPVLGTFTAREPLGSLNALALIRDDDDPTPLSEIILRVDQPGAVIEVAEAARLVAGNESPASISVDAPAVLTDVRSVVSGDLRAQGRRYVLAVLVTTSIAIAVVAFAAVTARRRDFGRRRALGARRANLVLLIIAHIAASSTLGGLLGLATGAVAVRALTSEPVHLAYPGAVMTLTVLVSSSAGFVPALTAALRDPVAVLRSA